jgi:hypothetical protein
MQMALIALFFCIYLYLFIMIILNPHARFIKHRLWAAKSAPSANFCLLGYLSGVLVNYSASKAPA